MRADASIFEPASAAGGDVQIVHTPDVRFHEIGTPAERSPRERSPRSTRTNSTFQSPAEGDPHEYDWALVQERRDREAAEEEAESYRPAPAAAVEVETLYLI